jgi:cell division protein FtsW
MVFSASAVMAKERYGSPYSFLLKQAIWALAGIALMLVAMKIDYRRFKSPAFVFSLLGLTTLM